MKFSDIILNINSKNKCTIPELPLLVPSKSLEFNNLTYLKQRTIKKKEKKKKNHTNKVRLQFI